MRTLLNSTLFVALCLPAVAAETLVVYSAPRCGPCKRFHRDLEKDASVAGGRPVRLVDVEASGAEAKQAGVRLTPTFVLVDGDREVRRTAGYQGPAALKAWLEGP